MTSWKGSNTTPAVVSKCPGDRTGPNAPQVSWRKGDPRKLYFSLDFIRFEAIGAEPRAIGPEPRDKVSRRPDNPERPQG